MVPPSSWRVSEEPQQNSEFRRYRQILAGLYLAAAVAVFGLLAVSVARELFFRRPQVVVPASSLSPDNPDPDELLECHRQVLGLLTELGKETCELFALPPSGDRGELASRWEDFSRAWRDEWDVADARCRFSELADTNMGLAYDRLAKVHSDLPTMRLKYQSLLVRFDDEQAAELARMRRALDLSHEAFVEMARQVAPTPPHP
jgi:hypothetical protein